MGSKLEEAAGSIGVEPRILASFPCRASRRRERLARLVASRLAFIAAAVAGLAGVMALAASSRASFYPYESSYSDTRPGPTTVVPTLAMALTILIAWGFGVVWNWTRYEDFFGVTTYYGVAGTDSGDNAHAILG